MPRACCPVLAIRSQAISVLGRLALAGSQPAGDALYSLAILDDNQPASLFIRQQPGQSLPASICRRFISC